MDRSIRRTLVILLLVVALIFGFVVFQQMESQDQEPEPAPDLSAMNTFVYDKPRELADFTLTSEEGGTMTRQSLEGQWTFVFVGYTNCPDICPATLSTLSQTDERLPAELPEPSYLLVSADPQRDTPERLKEYLDFFGEDFHGVTGDMDVLRSLARSVGAVFVHSDDGDGNTLVDHSGHLALINPQGSMTAVMQPPHDPDKLAEAYREIYQWTRRNQSGAG
ncbi:SCO family protein [Marinobacter zhanjiangensis]|uniref:Copper-binding protein n=1 Tax=Marinobacter zhanjiangensis TaxID=578215 RepID=A0ABQ3AM98_9GAMM|nr:SCO family protein [Marinobacter zhanjiangensis]GGY60772.1 copper-binding protein [Marinobacter zhanjiangensis]